jgi:drug/metabolite transporter (DMT)-like permease
MLSNFGIGELSALLSALCWAIGVILYRRLGTYVPPFELNFIKCVLVTGLLVPLLPIAHGWALPSLTATEFWLSVASGLIGLALADTLYLRALNQLGAGPMGVIGNLYSPFVVALSVVFLGERLGPLQIAGFVLVLAGVALISGRRERVVGAASMLGGIFLGICAILLMAVAIVMIKRVLEAQPLLWISFIRMLAACLGLAVLAGLRGQWRRLDPRTLRVSWPLLLAAAGIGQGLSTVFWLASNKYADASIAAILTETASVFIVLLAWLFLSEPLNRRSIAGCTLAMLGVGLMIL